MQIELSILRVETPAPPQLGLLQSIPIHQSPDWRLRPREVTDPCASLHKSLTIKCHSVVTPLININTSFICPPWIIGCSSSEICVIGVQFSYHQSPPPPVERPLRDRQPDRQIRQWDGGDDKISLWPGCVHPECPPPPLCGLVVHRPVCKLPAVTDDYDGDWLARRPISSGITTIPHAIIQFDWSSNLSTLGSHSSLPATLHHHSTALWLAINQQGE